MAVHFFLSFFLQLLHNGLNICVIIRANPLSNSDMKIRYNLVLMTLLNIAFVNDAMAQQDAQFSLFPFQQLYWNPATAAADGQTHLQIHNRWQWSGYQPTLDDGGAPTTLVVSAQVPLTFIKSAVGVHYVSDRIGASGNQEVQLSFARRFKVGDNRSKLWIDKSKSRNDHNKLELK